MSNSPESTFILLGLTGTGKTNFLVALDVVLNDQPDPDGLCHSELAPDRAYLQPLKEKWLRGEELDHTSRHQPPPPHQLIVKHRASEKTAGIYLPDLAGETFNSHFVTRSIPGDLCTRLKQAAGILLFIHSAHKADHDILQHPTLIDSSPLPESSSSTTIDDWQIENASPQVKLVDLLQFITSMDLQRRPLKIAVIISAWDLVEKTITSTPSASTSLPTKPANFLSAQWPLLNQYLYSHIDIFPFRVYGMSARGASTKDDDIVRLTSLDRPRDRLLVVDGPHRSNDITRPVRWLLGPLDPFESSND